MTILSILQEILGTYIRNKDEYLFHCAFCHHRKKKLSINIVSGKWHCWVCNARGGHIIWLLKKLNVSKQLLEKAKESFKELDYTPYKSSATDVKLYLPSEYKPLWIPEKTISYYHALTYLQKRKIRTDDILRYRIGYCNEGIYSGRIIIPSYDKNNQLNYFTARSFYNANMKYKNPPVSKNVVVFESMVDWSEEIVLVEGMFDAISIRRNAVPLLGKFIPKKLELEILTNGVSNITIFLDDDAKLDAMELEKYLNQYDINVRIVLSNKKDASEIGFEEAWTQIERATTTNLKTLIEQRLSKV